MSITVSIALATICFTYQGAPECHPVLLGKNSATPTGIFDLKRRYTRSPGYGGDVLQFKETDSEVYAIHRVWLLRPEQNRLSRFHSGRTADRFISAGCVNVMPDVYTKLLECCVDQRLEIK